VLGALLGLALLRTLTDPTPADRASGSGATEPATT